MRKVISKDGTTIAYEERGQGPTFVLANGAMGHREFFGGELLAAELANAFTVYDYDRRE